MFGSRAWAFGSKAWALTAVLYALSLKVKKSCIRYENDVSTISILDVQCRYVNGAQVLSECRYTHLVFLPAPDLSLCSDVLDPGLAVPCIYCFHICVGF